MPRLSLGLGLWVLVATHPFPARADIHAAPSTSPAPPSPATAGVVVVALAGATDAAWPLARAIYGESSLRPVSMDDARARVLCGEVAPPDSPAEVRDLADAVGSLRGDDAPSRFMLGDIASRFSARAVVVVRADAGHPSARVFLPETRAFDAATYSPDEGQSLSWSAAARSLLRTFGDRNSIALGPEKVPPLATHDGPRPPPPHREFYESGWFWGALGAAAVAGGTVFLATRDSGASTIHLHLEVPR